jgi:hypothetical protein
MFNQVLNIGVTPWRWQSTAETCSRKYCIFIYTLYVQLVWFLSEIYHCAKWMTPKYNLLYLEFQYLNVRCHAWMFYLAGSLHSLLTNHARCCVCYLCRRTNPTVNNTVSISVTAWHSVIYFNIIFVARHFTVRRRRSLSITTVLN